MLSDQLQKSMDSFKVMTECPVILALLFQLHRNIVSKTMPFMVEAVVGVLALQPAQQTAAHNAAGKEDTLFLGMAAEIDNRPAYVELKSLQVKVFLFLQDSFVSGLWN